MTYWYYQSLKRWTWRRFSISIYLPHLDRRNKRQKRRSRSFCSKIRSIAPLMSTHPYSDTMQPNWKMFCIAISFSPVRIIMVAFLCKTFGPKIISVLPTVAILRVNVGAESFISMLSQWKSFKSVTPEKICEYQWKIPIVFLHLQVELNTCNQMDELFPLTTCTASAWLKGSIKFGWWHWNICHLWVIWWVIIGKKCYALITTCISNVTALGTSKLIT